MSGLIISCGTVVTMNPSREIIQNGAVAVENDRIVEVGRAKELGPKHEEKVILDIHGKLLLPGFIDGHNHVSHFLTKDISDAGDAASSLYQMIFPFEANMTP